MLYSPLSLSIVQPRKTTHSHTLTQTKVGKATGNHLISQIIPVRTATQTKRSLYAKDLSYVRELIHTFLAQILQNDLTCSGVRVNGPRFRPVVGLDGRTP